MFTPFETFEQIKEGLCSYLETAYRIADPLLFEERGELIRSIGAAGEEPRIAQEAFVESTPRFAAGQMLSDLIAEYPQLPASLVNLAAHGTTVGRLPLYDHQAEAIRAFLGRMNLVLATGTGSGKTEAFILPVLGDILRQALTWPAVTGSPQHGRYDDLNRQWLHGRRHERRPAAVRAMILYPMNALVNDQVQRLRRILASSASDAWQNTNLHGNRIYFGMYTGDAEVPGHWLQESKRRRLLRYLAQIRTTWAALGVEHQNRGYWPNPDGCEMLTRWDMQAAPPDILVTNYSMLEYMLVRPIEGHIFETTRRWLETEPGALFTLVVDEAHTYVGARGTEISYLIRRLKERLQLGADDPRFRCIATSASLPTDDTARTRVTEFASSLFAVAPQSLAIIDGRTTANTQGYQATPDDEQRFAQYFASLRENNDSESREHAAALLLDEHAPVGSRVDSVQLYAALRDDPVIDAIRARTARNATQLDLLQRDLFGGSGTSERQREAIGGALAAGAIARINDDPEALNLLSTRIHMLFRGVPGIWACMDATCPEVDERFRRDGVRRPVGKLYHYQRPWCDCGARVLELFTCRVCGLAFLGGIADANGGLWPWTDDLEGGKPDYSDFTIFGVERPSDQPAVQVEYRSTRTTRVANATDLFTRETFYVRPSTVRGAHNPFPFSCPRCSTRRSTLNPDSQIIEPLRTRGSKAFSVLIEEAYRTQPDGDTTTANRGRKALTFADSRQDAAMLASDLEVDHNRDVLRQVFYYLLVRCGSCRGSGVTTLPANLTGGDPIEFECEVCLGSGQRRTPLPVEELRESSLALLNERRINPTFDDVPNYFTQLLPEFNPNRFEADRHINTAIRDEIAARDIGLEPIGLASWHAVFANERVTAFDTLTRDESVALIDNVVRLLAAENVLLPPTLDSQYWHDLVDRYEQQLVLPPGGQTAPQRVVFSLTAQTRLGRYMNAVGRRLVEAGRLLNQANIDVWLAAVEAPIHRALLELRLLNPDIRGQGTGLNINRFQLTLMPEDCVVCTACQYIMRVALLDVCLRCGQRTEPAAGFRRNYYRRSADLALRRPPYPDPFSLRVKEHTAQIEKPEARKTELKFQDVFIGDADPDDERVDILSVTTTMEMGIDIGALSAVGLRNIPPTVANYQQRAGRAGRRGNAVATVVGFAQQRSHDQYYFADPPRIVSDPPRVPSIQVDNEVIARRHIRALILQRFFEQWPPTNAQQQVPGLLNAWGDVRTFWTNNGQDALRAFIGTHREALIRRAEQVAAEGVRQHAAAWVVAIADDVTDALTNRANDEDILAVLLDRALLPRHAFPIDVVSLYTDRQGVANERERGIQRDLGIALSEFAPGAEIVRDKQIYTIAGLYEPFNFRPQFGPTGKFIECRLCHAIQQIQYTDPDPVQCNVCRGSNLWVMPLVRPRGFCSDWAVAGGARPYRGGGRDRIGTTTPAQLAVGQYCYTSQDSVRPASSPRMLARISLQPLFIVNRGDANQPGFEICTTCGRSLPPNAPNHTVPVDLPPRFGPNQGPRAGTVCQGRARGRVRSILGYDFPTEVIQLGIELPPSCRADMREPSGRALWVSLGSVLRNAAARYLQVGPEELRVGVRPSPTNDGRLTGEIFIYDSLPGGAGHARSIMRDIEPILASAENDAEHCPNPACTEACYSCLMSYDNQPLHPILSRTMAGAMLAAARGVVPNPISRDDQALLLQRTIPFALDNWTARSNVDIAGHSTPLAFEDNTGRSFVPLLRPALLEESDGCAPFIDAGCFAASFTDFDVVRRPFWLIQQLAALSR